jgi:broad specificity phosphatase PhoE
VTTFHLVRHALHAGLGHGLAGHADVPLSEAGRIQAERLADRLERGRPDILQSSPMLRARQTAGPLSRRLGLAVAIAPAIREIDFGAWTGRSFEDLGRDPAWHRWNAVRSAAATPGGETMLQVQSRFVAHLLALHAAHPDARVVLFSHADPIRSALAHWLGTPLDLFLRIEVSPASVSTILLDAGGPRILHVNEAVPE